jgi:hypothetical protein
MAVYLDFEEGTRTFYTVNCEGKRVLRTGFGMFPDSLPAATA